MIYDILTNVNDNQTIILDHILQFVHQIIKRTLM